MSIYFRTTHIFKKYVEPLKNAKTQQDEWKNEKNEKYNAALREIIKLYLNSLSGKVGQREYVKDISFCFTENQLQSFVQNHSDIVYNEIPKMNCMKVEGLNKKYKYKKENAIPFHIAAFIYSYARSHMYQSILSKVDSKFFTDTDSCHMLEEDIDKLEDEGHGFGKFHLGGEFGDYEKEILFKVERYYTIAPKCYAMFGKYENGKEAQKIRFKGINQKCDKILEIVEPENEKKYRDINVKEFNKKQISEKFDMYQELNIACCEKLYQNLTDNKCVAILSSHIKRSTGFRSISSMHQNFLIKTISPTGVVNN